MKAAKEETPGQNLGGLCPAWACDAVHGVSPPRELTQLSVHFCLAVSRRHDRLTD